MNAPQHLDEQARAKWAEVLPILQSRGNVAQGTLDALAAYCQAWSRWTAAEQQVTALGLVVKSPAGFAVENPYFGIAKKALIEMHRWGKELGLTGRTSKRKAEADDEEEEGADISDVLVQILHSPGAA